MQEWDIIDMALPLKSWTRTVPLSEGIDLLLAVEPGMDYAVWRDKADALLPHADPSYRQTLLRLIRRMFLELDDETILGTPFLELIRSGDETRRRHLFCARYALAHPWCLLASRRLILPRLARNAEQAEISIEEWDAFVSRFIEDSASEASRRKTRSTITGVFQNLGVVDREGPSTAPTRLQRGRPDAVAFGWMVADQLASELRSTATRTWAVTSSDAAQLFAIDDATGRKCLTAAIKSGELLAARMGTESAVRAPLTYGHRTLELAG